MKKYKCYIYSNSSYEREYEVTTSSALKCAEKLGRYEGGEIVTVTTKGGKMISQARYTCNEGGYYYRAYIDKGTQY